MWMMESLCLNPVLFGDDTTYMETSKHFVVIQSTTNPQGRKIVKNTHIDKATGEVRGFVVMNDSGEIECTSEVMRRYKGLPEQVLYTWNKEGISVLLEFERPEKNQSLQQDYFEMPSITPRIDMGKE
jgi:hypothetical protein